MAKAFYRSMKPGEEPAPELIEVRMAPIEGSVDPEDINRFLDALDWLDEHDPDHAIRLKDRAFYFEDPDVAMLFKLKFR